MERVAYDSLGRVTRVVIAPQDAAQREVVYGYEPSPGATDTDRWNLRTVTDGEHRLTSYTYDVFGGISQTHDALGQDFFYSRNAFGPLVLITTTNNPNGTTGEDRTQVLVPDLRGRITSLTQETWTYYRDGALRAHATFDGRTTRYVRDFTTGRLSGIVYPDALPTSPKAPDVNFEYFANDLLRTASTIDPITNTKVSTQYDYDSVNRLSSRTRPDSSGVPRTVAYQYTTQMLHISGCQQLSAARLQRVSRCVCAKLWAPTRAPT